MFIVVIIINHRSLQVAKSVYEARLGDIVYKTDIYDNEALGDVAMATTFCEKGTRITKTAITSVMCEISKHYIVLRPGFHYQRTQL